LKYALLIAFFICTIPFNCPAAELTSGNFKLTYASDEVLEEFHDNVYFGKSFFLFRGKSSLTIEEQVQNKVTGIITKVQTILEMFPKKIFFNVVLFDSEKQVQAVYKKEYGIDVPYIAFYSTISDTIYISTNNVTLRVFSHEMAHDVIFHYFYKQPAVKIHELMAQFVEAHIED
jgi:hypothetical protein